MTKEPKTIYLFAQKIYYDHQLLICVDLQSGYTKYPCLNSHWNSWSQDKKLMWKNWPLREDVVVEECNGRRYKLWGIRSFLPPFYIKLGLMK